jgi:PACS-1 cytosolic sorting protein
MRLGKKKEKDRDGEKEQCIDGVARLICSAKQSHPVPLRGELGRRKLRRDSSFNLFPFHSLHRRNRVDWREVLPAFVAMANAREKFPGGFDRRSLVRGLVNQSTTSQASQRLIFLLHFTYSCKIV